MLILHTQLKFKGKIYKHNTCTTAMLQHGGALQILHILLNVHCASKATGFVFLSTV